MVTAAVDVQKDSIHYAIVGWGMDEEHWLIAVDAVRTWDELADAICRNTFGEKALPLRIGLIDSRHRREEVMEFCRRWPVMRMIAGVDREAPIPFSTVKIDRHPRTGAPLPASMTVWTITVGMFKDLLAHRMTATAAGSAEGGRIHLPADLPEARWKELASEHKVMERHGAKMKALWVLKPGHVRNELLDLMTYNAAAGRLIRCDTLRSPTRAKQVPTKPKPSNPSRPRSRQGYSSAARTPSEALPRILREQ